MRRIVEQLLQIPTATKIPIILFTKGGGSWLPEIAASGCHALGLDWATEIDHARRLVGNQVALQGNLDPCVLYSSDEVIRSEVKKVLEKFGKGSGHVFNWAMAYTSMLTRTKSRSW